MRILVTGSNGFVGAALMPFLENLGHQVDGIDRDPSPIYKVHKNTVISNILNIKNIPDLQKKYDLIIHCAAAKGDFGISKQEYYTDNETVTQTLVEFAEALQINKIIYYSTVSVYGHQPKPCGEEGKLKSNTIYGDSKLAGEVVIKNWLDKDQNNQAIFLRPSVIYGVNNYANMYNLIDRLYGNPLFMIGKGKNVKSMVALKNMIDMNVFVIENGFKKPLAIYNCLDKPYYSVRQLIQIITKVEGFKKPKITLPIWLAYILTFPFEILSKLTGKDLKINWNRIHKFTTATDYLAEKIRAEGYVQKHSIENELTAMAKWYKTTKNG